MILIDILYDIVIYESEKNITLASFILLFEGWPTQRKQKGDFTGPSSAQKFQKIEQNLHKQNGHKEEYVLYTSNSCLVSGTEAFLSDRSDIEVVSPPR